MKTRFNKLIPLCFASALVISCAKDQTNIPAKTIEKAETEQQVRGEKIPDQYIVEIAPGLISNLLGNLTDYSTKTQIALDAVNGVLAQLPNGDDIEVLSVYSTAINGFAAKLTPEQLAVLETLKEVVSIEQDQILGLADIQPEKNKIYTDTKADQKPYGIIRTGHASGAGKRAFIIDTGIDLDHPDLDVNVSLSKNFDTTTGCGLLGILFGCPDTGGNPDDDHGHGSHCAGTVAGLNNGAGVLGVAYDAEVVAIKVLGATGSGSTSAIIQGVDYVASVGVAGNVVNMSLGGGVSTSLDNAVIAAAQKGLLFALAAGNDSQNANNSSPARANGANIYTVSAMDSNDNFASFSNFGNPPVDFCAPGVSVYSTSNNGGYATLSGTSMAAPHVAGLLLLRGGAPATDGFVKNDPDGNADPIAHL